MHVTDDAVEVDVAEGDAEYDGDAVTDAEAPIVKDADAVLDSDPDAVAVRVAARLDVVVGIGDWDPVALMLAVLAGVADDEAVIGGDGVTGGETVEVSVGVGSAPNDKEGVVLTVLEGVTLTDADADGEPVGDGVRVEVVVLDGVRDGVAVA